MQQGEGGRSTDSRTPLASRSLAPRIARLQEQGYEFHLTYIWLPSVDVAIARVAKRVRQGGHDIPEAVIRRRYRAGLHHFFTIYRPMAHTWRVFNNARLGAPRLVASGGRAERTRIYLIEIWDQIRNGGGHGV